MKHQLNTIFQQKLVIVSIVLTLTWGAADFYQRFTNTNKEQRLISDETVLNELVPTGVTEEQKQHIINLYQQYRDEENINDGQVTKRNQGLTAEQQAQQNGLLKEMFVGDNKLELKAVIFKDNAIEKSAVGSITPKGSQALLLVSNTVTGESEIEAFTNHSQVYGYFLLIEKNTQVTLSKELIQSNDNAQINKQQVITLTMYQPITQKNVQTIPQVSTENNNDKEK